MGVILCEFESRPPHEGDQQLLVSFSLYMHLMSDIFVILRKLMTNDMHTLKNDILTIQVRKHGAELTSIRKGETEYLWQADPAFWGRHSPVLFPIVGSVWEKRYRVDGVEYEMGQHGFARDMDFSFVDGNDAEVRYRLESSEETLAKYPFLLFLKSPISWKEADLM